MQKFLLKHSLISIFLLCTFLISSSAFKFNFNSEGEFTVLQFTDLHYGQGNDANDVKTLQLQRDMIARVKPDLIVVSGDGVSGHKGYYFGTFSKRNFFKNNWEKFTQAINEAGIPYAFTVGNHDLEGDLDRKGITKLEMTSPLSVRKTSEGMENSLIFYVPIYSSKKKGDLAANIWLFDTGVRGCGGIEDSWGCIEEPQIQWYEKESDKIKEKYGTNVHHIAFLHIPIPEYMMLADEMEFYGTQAEWVNCPKANSGFFDRVKNKNDISAIFAGHDHLNNFGGNYNGIELVYGQKSGWGNYGRVRGVRVIKFKEDVDANGKLNVERNHYVIFENGTIDTSKAARYKSGEKQGYCLSAGFNTTFRLIRATGIFDYLLLGGEILLLALAVYGVYVFRKRNSRSINKEPIPFDELNDADEGIQETNKA